MQNINQEIKLLTKLQQETKEEIYKCCNDRNYSKAAKLMYKQSLILQKINKLKGV